MLDARAEVIAMLTAHADRVRAITDIVRRVRSAGAGFSSGGLGQAGFFLSTGAANTMHVFPACALGSPFRNFSTSVVRRIPRRRAAFATMPWDCSNASRIKVDSIMDRWLLRFIPPRGNAWPSHGFCASSSAHTNAGTGSGKGGSSKISTAELGCPALR
jgi:hypothetical protein